METLITAGSVVGTVVLGIMVLTVFFHLVAWIGAKLRPRPAALDVSGLLASGAWINIRMIDGTSIEDVRFSGMADWKSAGGALPFPLQDAVIAEGDRRFIVPVRRIRLLEVRLPDAAA